MANLTLRKMADKEHKGFSDSEMRFITAFFSNMQTKPEVDWAKAAVDAGLKDARCARDRFRQIMAKHGFQASSSSSPRKGKAASGEEGKEASTAKVTKRAPRKKSAKKTKEEKKNEDGQEEMDVKGIKDEDTGDM